MTSDSNGLITAKNALRVTLLRGDLWKKYECRTESYALERSLSFFVSFDINGELILVIFTMASFLYFQK